MNNYKSLLKNCKICPKKCGANRFKKNGVCGADSDVMLSLVNVHMWEEPPISGQNGSGTIFFTNCNLNCVFCQNYEISQQGLGKKISIENLSEIFLKQQEKKVHNINLVSPTQYIPQIQQAIIIAKNNGLKIPIVYNTNGYENVESLKLLDGLIDIYLPDIKYFSSEISLEYSGVSNYFEKAKNAVIEMRRQVKHDIFNNNIMEKGIIIRHLILPSYKEDSKKILLWIKENMGDKTYISLLNQYIPVNKAQNYKKINRKLTTFEYQNVTDYFLEIGLKNGFIQKRSSATSSFTLVFDLSGF